MFCAKSGEMQSIRQVVAVYILAYHDEDRCLSASTHFGADFGAEACNRYKQKWLTLGLNPL